MVIINGYLNVKSSDTIFDIFVCFQVKLTYHDGSPVQDMSNPVTVSYGYSYDHESYKEEKYKLSKHGMVELNFYPALENQTVLGIEVSKRLHVTCYVPVLVSGINYCLTQISNIVKNKLYFD